MRRHFLGSVLFLFALVDTVHAFDRFEVLQHCEKSTSDRCIVAIFEAARVEIIRMGREEDFDTETGLMKQVQAYLDRAQENADRIESNDERQARLERIAQLQDTAELELASGMMWVASSAAYAAIGGDSLSGYPEVGNAMVPDIMDLWARWLDRLKNSTETPYSVNDNDAQEAIVGFPPIIAYYQAKMGFLADATVTLERYMQRLQDLEAMFPAEVFRESSDIVELARAQLDLINLKQEVQAFGDLPSERVAEFLAEHGPTTASDLSNMLIDSGAFKAALAVIPAIEDPNPAAYFMMKILNAAPELISQEEYLAFLVKYVESSTYFHPRFVDPTLDQLLLERPASVATHALLQAVKQIRNPDGAMVLLVGIYDQTPSSVPSDLLEAFVKERGEELVESRDAVVGFLARTGFPVQAREVLSRIEDPDQAAIAMAALINEWPQEIAQPELSDFLEAHGDTLKSWSLSQLVDALLGARRLDEVYAMAAKLGDPNRAAEAVLALVSAAPEEVSPEELAELLDKWGADLEDHARSDLVGVLVEAGRHDEASSLLRTIKDPGISARTLSYFIETAPKSVSGAHFMEFLGALGNSTDLYATSSLAIALAEAHRINEARLLLQAVSDPNDAAYVLGNILEAAPEFMTPRDAVSLYSGWRDELEIDMLFDLADAMTALGRLEEARTLVGGMAEALRQDPQRIEGLEDRLSVVKLACGTDGSNPFMFGTRVPHLATDLLPEMLELVDAETRPCVRADLLGALGGSLRLASE